MSDKAIFRRSLVIGFFYRLVRGCNYFYGFGVEGAIFSVKYSEEMEWMV